MSWLGQLFTRRRRYVELSESIREHLDEKVADLMDDGMTQKAAEQAARRQFGNVILIEERSRQVWQWPTTESIVEDVRFALRQLCKSPGFTATAIVTLTMCIGANAVVFSLLNGLVLRPLNVPDGQTSIRFRSGRATLPACRIPITSICATEIGASTASSHTKYQRLVWIRMATHLRSG